MIIKREYNDLGDSEIDKVWYDSTSVLYSECTGDKNGLKTLTVIFKTGSRYVYYDVDANDYIMFVHGSIDGSNGKALNKFIKSKYNCEKLESVNISNYKII